MTTTSWTIGERHNGHFCWAHLDGRDEEAMRWLDDEAHALPPTARFNLTTAETRPRCQPLHEGVIINLRGPRLSAEDEGDELVSIRIWAERGRVVSVTYRHMAGLENLRERMEHGHSNDHRRVRVVRHHIAADAGRYHAADAAARRDQAEGGRERR